MWTLTNVALHTFNHVALFATLAFVHFLGVNSILVLWAVVAVTTEFPMAGIKTAQIFYFITPSCDAVIACLFIS